MATYAHPLTSASRTSPQGFLKIFGKVFTSSGVIDPDALKVSAQVTPDLSVIVSGSLNDDHVIFIHSNGTFIQAWNAQDETVDVPLNDSGVTKTDALVAYVDMTEGSIENANNPGAMKFLVVRRGGSLTGAPNSTEIEAETGENPYIELAHITVGTGVDAKINSGNIVEKRVRAYVDGDKIAPQSVDTTQIKDGSLTNAKLSTTAGELGGEWQSWTPTFGGHSGMAISSVVINMARYKQVGKVVTFQLSANFTLGSPAAPGINFSIPVPANTSNGTQVLGAYASDGGAVFAFAYITSSGNGSVQKPSNFALGADKGIRAFGTYEAA